MNRREYLAAGAAITTVGVAGCQSWFRGDTVDDSYLWWKGIDVVWECEGSRFLRTLLNARIDRDTTVYGEVATEIEGVVASPTDIRINDELHDDLQGAFDNVRYLVGFCWDGNDGEECRNPSVSQDTFNAVQFNDRVDIRLVDTNVEIRDVDAGAGATPSDRADFLTFDFAERHKDLNPPSW